MYDSADTEAPRQFFGQRTCSNIDGEMAAAGKRVETHITKRFREAMAGVITDEQYRLLCQRIKYAERPGFLRG
jgi:hypothetical protein